MKKNLTRHYCGDILTIFNTASGQIRWSVLADDSVIYSKTAFNSIEKAMMDLFSHYSHS